MLLDVSRLRSMIFVMSQIMVPNNFQSFISILTGHVNSGVIPMSRIDDAVTRILRVKFTMGLFENPYSDASMAEQLGKQVLNKLWCKFRMLSSA